MNVNMLNRSFTDSYRLGDKPVNAVSADVFSTSGGEKPQDIVNAFTATPVDSVSILTIVPMRLLSK